MNDLHFDCGLFIAPGFQSLDPSNDVESFDDFSKNAVLPIEMRDLISGDEELTAVCIWSFVCHREKKRSTVFQRQILIVKVGTIY